MKKLILLIFLASFGLSAEEYKVSKLEWVATQINIVCALQGHLAVKCIGQVHKDHIDVNFSPRTKNMDDKTYGQFKTNLLKSLKAVAKRYKFPEEAVMAKVIPVHRVIDPNKK